MRLFLPDHPEKRPDFGGVFLADRQGIGFGLYGKKRFGQRSGIVGDGLLGEAQKHKARDIADDETVRRFRTDQKQIARFVRDGFPKAESDPFPETIWTSSKKECRWTSTGKTSRSRIRISNGS